MGVSEGRGGRRHATPPSFYIYNPQTACPACRVFFGHFVLENEEKTACNMARRPLTKTLSCIPTLLAPSPTPVRVSALAYYEEETRRTHPYPDKVTCSSWAPTQKMLRVTRRPPGWVSQSMRRGGLPDTPTPTSDAQKLKGNEKKNVPKCGREKQRKWLLSRGGGV